MVHKKLKCLYSLHMCVFGSSERTWLDPIKTNLLRREDGVGGMRQEEGWDRIQSEYPTGQQTEVWFF